MTSEGDGQFRKVPYDKNGKTYYRNEIYISSKVADDSAFPFQAGENVSIKITEDGKILVEKKKGF